MKTFILPERDKWNTDKMVPYDAAMAAYLGLIFDPGRAVIDVGANVGKIACFLAARTSKLVICFEPAPSTYQALMANVAEYGNIVVRQLALSGPLWHRSTQAFIGDGTVSGHLCTTSSQGSTVVVNVACLDSVVDRDLDVGLIKIDVEGNELDVLYGAAETIEKWKPLLVIEVIDAHLRRGGTSRKAIFRFTKEFGYDRAVNKFGIVEKADKGTGASDVFFLPKDWPAPRLYLAYRKLHEEISNE